MFCEIGDKVVSETPQTLLSGLIAVTRVLEQVSSCHNKQKTGIDYITLQMQECLQLMLGLRDLFTDETPLCKRVEDFVLGFVGILLHFSIPSRMQIFSFIFPDILTVASQYKSFPAIPLLLKDSFTRMTTTSFLLDYFVKNMTVHTGEYFNGRS